MGLIIELAYSKRVVRDFQTAFRVHVFTAKFIKMKHSIDEMRSDTLLLVPNFFQSSSMPCAVRMDTPILNKHTIREGLEFLELVAAVRVLILRRITFRRYFSAWSFSLTAN